MKRFRNAAPFLWAGLIFGTSCSVIHRKAFVGVVGGALNAPRFDDFWAHWWWLAVKGWHFAEFAILYLLIRAALLPHNRRLAIPLAILFAMSDEWHQTFVPGRGGTWTDVAIDAAGIVAAASIAGLCIRTKRKGPD